MHIAVTGATGFLGRYIVRRLTESGHTCHCWARSKSDRSGFAESEKSITWVQGDLTNMKSMNRLVQGVDGVIHAALYRPGRRFRGAEGDLPTFVERNVLGTIRLIECARTANVKRFVFISTCAVHERILDDRKLDEAHPLWPASHYGAHKAAIEKFIHSYGLGSEYDICSLRPTGIYGLARPVENSKWFDLVQRVSRGEAISSGTGGKEVHAGDVAKAAELLLTAGGVAGEAYNCYDMYIADETVATIAKEVTGSDAKIEPLNKGAKHEIDTSKLRALGMTFGGRARLEATIREMVAKQVEV